MKAPDSHLLGGGIAGRGAKQRALDGLVVPRRASAGCYTEQQIADLIKAGDVSPEEREAKARVARLDSNRGTIAERLDQVRQLADEVEGLVAAATYIEDTRHLLGALNVAVRELDVALSRAEAGSDAVAAVAP